MSRWQVKTLLDILDSPEDNQKLLLAVDGVLGLAKAAKYAAAYLQESLAETAFRIRDEVIKSGCDWVHAICEVIEYCEGQKYCDKCGQQHKTKKVFYWATDAQPIHWIIAALIAEVRKTETEGTEDFKEEAIKPEIHPVTYAIGQEDDNGYGMWDGPIPDLQEMLEVNGRDKNSVIIRFNADGSDEVLYRWYTGAGPNCQWSLESRERN